MHDVHYYLFCLPYQPLDQVPGLFSALDKYLCSSVRFRVLLAYTYTFFLITFHLQMYKLVTF